LGWDFVWQRPQHLISRLARHHRVLFVQEPITNTEISEPKLERFTGAGPQPVTVLRLNFPSPEHYWIGFNGTRTQPIYERLLIDYLHAEAYTDPILWLYTPMALPFVDLIRPALLIYDVMDELSAFKGAAAELKQKERSLLRQADIVFTGGVGMYQARLPYATQLHLFPSGVEIDHFAQAAAPALKPPPDLATLPHPILGYFGVIDERMDLDLLAYLATAHPEWNIALLGPVRKIDPAELPQAPNLHYLGIKDYQALPAYLAHFDVALVPFAINEATHYLSPTKTLEYLAAHKPVVSTPIPDIVELYGDYVRIGSTPDEFLTQVELALAETSIQKAKRCMEEEELLARYHWDTIANQMHTIIHAELARKNAQAAWLKQPAAVPT
jgi:UDP-galactopyranose mutase